MFGSKDVVLRLTQVNLMTLLGISTVLVLFFDGIDQRVLRLLWKHLHRNVVETAPKDEEAQVGTPRNDPKNEQPKK
eukprot:5105931-Amphidinium_carterae.1